MAVPPNSREKTALASRSYNGLMLGQIIVSRSALRGRRTMMLDAAIPRGICFLFISAFSVSHGVLVMRRLEPERKPALPKLRSGSGRAVR